MADAPQVLVVFRKLRDSRLTATDCSEGLQLRPVEFFGGPLDGRRIDLESWVNYVDTADGSVRYQVIKDRAWTGDALSAYGDAISDIGCD